ncbi:hypothetical protein B0H63DRAFT_267026 [Podospora didyma]|uniref:Secreted protein n=1 Tax=Podospora didyma TaxID=330526 RepID=A0AAE0KE77_9PEZI|nr:hypothetical protein B0H63DRAFT_267026 [Podospora didyma]
MGSPVMAPFALLYLLPFCAPAIAIARREFSKAGAGCQVTDRCLCFTYPGPLAQPSPSYPSFLSSTASKPASFAQSQTPFQLSVD